MSVVLWSSGGSLTSFGNGGAIDQRTAKRYEQSKDEGAGAVPAIVSCTRIALASDPCREQQIKFAQFDLLAN
jgi:hypothetical protein